MRRLPRAVAQTCTNVQVFKQQATQLENWQSKQNRGQVSENAGDLAFDALVLRALES